MATPSRCGAAATGVSGCFARRRALSGRRAGGAARRASRSTWSIERQSRAVAIGPGDRPVGSGHRSRSGCTRVDAGPGAQRPAGCLRHARFSGCRNDQPVAGQRQHARTSAARRPFRRGVGRATGCQPPAATHLRTSFRQWTCSFERSRADHRRRVDAGWVAVGRDYSPGRSTHTLAHFSGGRRCSKRRGQRARFDRTGAVAG